MGNIRPAAADTKIESNNSFKYININPPTLLFRIQCGSIFPPRKVEHR